MKQFVISIRDSNVKPAYLAKWLSTVLPGNKSLTELLIDARKLIDGEKLKVEYLNSDEKCEFCNIDVEHIEDEHEQMMRLIDERQSALQKLMVDGALGDVNAALAYCKAVYNGEVRQFSGPIAAC